MKKFINENWFKIIVVGVLIGALGTHPYSYYQFTRWAMTICSVYLAYHYAEKEKKGWMWIFIALTILFNPIFPFYFAKNTWQVFDLLGTILLFTTFF